MEKKKIKICHYKFRDNAPAGIRTRVVPLEKGSSLGVKALNAWPDYTTGAC